MKDDRSIWLVRHGTRQDMVDPDWSTHAERPYDPPLAPQGVAEARQVGQQLRDARVDHILASPFLRALETAHHIAEALGLPVRIENGLGEMLNREWFPARPELDAPGELAQRFPRLDLAYSSAIHPTYPETEDQLLARTSATLRLLLERFAGNLVLVGHGASVYGLCRALATKAPIHNIPCCLIQISRRRGEWRLERDGFDTSYLAGLARR